MYTALGVDGKRVGDGESRYTEARLRMISWSCFARAASPSTMQPSAEIARPRLGGMPGSWFWFPRGAGETSGRRSRPW
jgi:hypothetical protein